ncbi:MAG: hypothetical protein H0U74_06700 [Bradymonadaceae bacterium]|nr:hypothetical protein [Lujinxingiaceae bacterium]
MFCDSILRGGLTGSAALGLGFLLFFGGCSGSSARPDRAPTVQVPEETLELDPMLIRVREGSTETETIDADEVFARAYAAFQSRRYEEATVHYELIIKYFATSRFYLPALYNGGLAYEQLQLWESAARNYRKVVEVFGGSKEATDAHYRLANVYSELGDYNQVVELMTEVMLRDLSHFDRIEAHVRRSNALLEIGSLVEAESGFRTLLRLNEQATENDQVPENSHFIVQSYFGLGRVYHQRVAAIRLMLPPERMGDDLQQKADLFLRAQSNYIRALRFHHPHWSVAAGYMIGRMYEDFYIDLFTAEIPDDLTDEEVAMYFDELRSQIKPLMERAIQVYERNLSLSQRIANSEQADRWVEQTATQLTRLRAYLSDPRTQRRAEKLVRAGRDLSELWDAGQLARDAVNEALHQATQLSAKRQKRTL